MSSTEPAFDLGFVGPCTFLRSELGQGTPPADAIAVLGIPSDEGSGWMPGARFGPRAMREMSLRFASGVGVGNGFWDPSTDTQLLVDEMREHKFWDCGDVDIVYTNLAATWENITQRVKDLKSAGATIVALGGDHGITGPVVRAFDGPINFIHFDAHMDYQPFVHGVERSHGNPVRWIHGLESVSNILQVGIRSFRTPRPDYDDSLSDGNQVILCHEIHEQGVEAALSGAHIEGPTYVSIDVDVLDAAIVPGASTPEPSGLSYDEMKMCLEVIARRCTVIGMDIVEVNPLMDLSSKFTSLIGVQLVLELIGRNRQHRGV